MNFDFSDNQREIQAQVRRVLEATCTDATLRAAADGRSLMGKEAWDELAAIGALGAAIPEAYGGSGLGRLELCLVAEEVGRANAPAPVSSSIYLAAEALLAAGSPAQKSAWLPRLAAGEAIGTLAHAGQAPGIGSRAPELTMRRGVVAGVATAVPDGQTATMAVLAVRDDDAGGATSLALVDLQASGVSRTATSSIDPTRPRATITFADAPAELVGVPGRGEATLAKVLQRAAILLAFEQIGGAQRCLDMARDYALQRYAFGRVIGSYQAIKHKLADVYARNRMALAHAYYGGWALATDAETPLAAAAARVSASEAFNFAAQENIQTHGGIGFTWEHPCHLLYRRARALSLELGAPHEWREIIADQLATAAAA